MKQIAEDGGIVVSLDENLIHFRMRKGSITHTLSFRNISDSWAAYFSRYNGLPAYQEKLWRSCFTQIRKLWVNYWLFSKEERRNAGVILKEMQAFSKERFQYMIHGNYSFRTKILLFISQIKNPFIMWLFFLGKKMIAPFRHDKHKLFD